MAGVAVSWAPDDSLQIIPDRLVSLSQGSRLGPYEILSPLGAGGMGEVYRARDTRLDRTVAIKILPAHLSDKPAMKERFDREAKAISSLNHPNICQLYDVGSQDGVDFLVMEYLEGETLADRLRKGSLTLDQVLKCALELCEGLEAAHRHGVVHRDLKPGNIMMTKSGAKLMDFGLAKAALTGIDTGSSTVRTMAHPLTAQGSIIGTFQYMAPEQVEGRDVDGRCDLFSLGAVLYEMVTGRRAFEGKSQLSVASAILEKEPEPISAVKPASPPALEYVIRTCLAKDPEQRWQTARDLSHVLRWVTGGGAPADAGAARTPVGRARGALLLAGFVVATATALALGWLSLTRAPAVERVTRTSIKPMPDSSFVLSNASGFALSPDGRMLAYVATTANGGSALWVRSMASVKAQQLAGTDGAGYPFWSPDSRFLGFFAGAKLKKIEANGGPPFTICDASDARGGTWSSRGEIVFTPSVNAGLYRVSASGGNPAPVTTLDASKSELSHRWPWFLPDGRHFLFLAGSVFTPIENPTNTIKVGSLDSSEVTTLLNSHAGAIEASGHIIFLRQNTLMAQPFDAARLTLTGDAVPIASQVQEQSIYSRGLFSASENGLLAYIEDSTSAARQLVWLDRSGKQIGAVPGADAYSAPRISKDGKRLLYYLDATGYDVWTYDIDRDVKTRQTFGSGASAQSNIYPVWSPDGRRIAYSSYRNGKHYVMMKPSDGSSSEEEVVGGGERYRFPLDWSPDGRHIIYQEGTPVGFAIRVVALDGDRKASTILESQFSHREGTFSRDGKWLAYTSNESGEYKIYVVPFPGPGGKWQISPGSGFSPRWRGDGKEIFYYSTDNKIMAADVTASGSSFEVGSVHQLFETSAYGAFSRYDVDSDGQRFIVPLEAGQQGAVITLTVNWLSDLRR